ncbi:snoRNP complex protein nop56 [Sparganum proliferum]
MKQRVSFLFEHASGYALLSTKMRQLSDVVDAMPEVSADYETFSQCFKLRGFVSFTSAENALENCNSISEGLVHDDLQSFLLSHLNDGKNVLLCVADRRLADAIKSPEAGLPENIQCTSESMASEIFRKIRQFFPFYIAELSHFAESQAQIGLGHSYSRAKVKFNVNRADNMVIQTISLLDQMDKDINTFSMRIKEWFSYHFPELMKIVPESSNYIKLVNLLRSRDQTTEDRLQEIEDIVQDREKAQAIVEAAKTSMGAEKALFRALRTRGRTPKYGLIFHSSFIGRAAKENKGRISRFLAAKCALATRIDCFSDILCNVYGKHLRQQVEDRLKYFESGEIPKTNAEAMAAAIIEANKVIRKLKKRAIATLNGSSSPNLSFYKKNDEADVPSSELKKKKKKKKHLTEQASVEASAPEPEEESVNAVDSKQEKKKKKQKRKHSLSESAAAEDVPTSAKKLKFESSAAAEDDSALTTPRKKKKKRSAAAAAAIASAPVELDED